ncbi:sulfotransferase [Streptomyces sp. DSM 44917]|uniref:Sulfotransferase n=1 Tax=Streptomyces boetiae TaxID=3075541 RepID=A0ABU2L5C3_9ACTN|nr:sulfotransferase [Streptomyces sp. DSM 44917]MDT0306760.1 sulfotransferase [Streptomyces sp. DSM 44917]
MNARQPAGRPVLVTGLPRSGTSWTGKMLQAGGELVYVNEPLNPSRPPGRSPGVLNASVSHAFQYICEDNEDVWLRAFRDTVRLRYRTAAELRVNRSLPDLARLAKNASAFTAGRLRGRRALLDDPYATLSAAWFARRLGAVAIVLVRDPVSWAGSWRKLGWTTYVHELLEQPLLMRDLLGEHAARLRELVGSQDELAKNAELWRVTYGAVDALRKETPSLHVIRYEDLAGDPMTAFEELYRLCGLRWNGPAREAVHRATSADNAPTRAMSWSLRGGLSRTAYQPMDSRAALTTYRDRLSPAEIARVRELTGAVRERFYA